MYTLSVVFFTVKENFFAAYADLMPFKSYRAGLKVIGKPRTDIKRAAIKPKSQELLGDGTKIPSARSRVPCPTGFTLMPQGRINIGSQNKGLRLIAQGIVPLG